MSSSIYLSESSQLTGLNPDILPETEDSYFLGSGPCVIRRLSNPVGDGTDFENMVISGKFKTNDTRNDPTTFFITAYRDGPEDGEDTEHFNNGYGVALMPLNTQAAADGAYNVFVVDNATGVPRVVLEDVVHTGWGALPNIRATSVTLNPDTYYNFELRFGAGGTLEFYMAEVGSLFGAAVIENGSYQHQAQGTYYGVSMSYNEGKVWSVDNIAISYTDPQYPLHEYLLDGSEFPDSCVVKAYCYAEGDDGGSVPAFGVKLMAWNYTTETWDEKVTHAYGPGDGSFLLSTELDRTDYISPSDEYLRILIINEYPSDFDD